MGGKRESEKRKKERRVSERGTSSTLLNISNE
jgi:hypothetical protein